MNNELKELAVLIPAYKPEKTLISLSEELLAQGFGEVIIVNDGSGETFSPIFERVEALGCTLLTHEMNKGKGRALKTGINYLLVQKSNVRGVITADADGQHLVKDIIRIGQELLQTEDTLVLGSRAFSGNVPLKSRFGNSITRAIFNFVSGQKVRDTQTGLRGIPFAALEKMVTLRGERYEFEMNMLLEAKRCNLVIKEVEIETVYINDNSGSHFNPIVDSWKIYKQIFTYSGATIYRHIIMFGGSSLLAFGIDYLIFTLLNILVPRMSFLNLSDAQAFVIPFIGLKIEPVLLIAVVGARVISSTVNFIVNRNIVFAKKGGSLAKHIFGYYLLVVIIMIANYAIISGLKSIGINVYVAKVITEAVLFVLSFFVQKRVVFK